MAGTGAPKGNQYAKKESTGQKISLYLTADDLQLLRYVLEKYGHDDLSDAACFDLARKAAKCGINNLLNPEYYQSATRRLIAQKKEKKTMLSWNSQTGRYEAEIDGKLMTVDRDIFAECEQERRKTYMEEQGMSEEEAEQKAWDETREATQWIGCDGATLDGVAQG